MMRLAVVGEHVENSHSPEIHGFLFNKFNKTCTYEKVSISQDRFHECAEELFSRFDAFNVTVPFKQAILPHLQSLQGNVELLLSANTVISDGREGYSTDGGGFLLMLSAAGLEVRGKRILVLGAGRSVVFALCNAGAEVFVYEKDVFRLETFRRRMGMFTICRQLPLRPFDLIVNCTGIGMHGTEGMLPTAEYEGGSTGSVEPLLSLCGGAVDLIYEPARSEFLRVAEKYKKPTLNGEAMLFFQAYLADCIILGRYSSPGEACTLWEKYRETL